MSDSANLVRQLFDSGKSLEEITALIEVKGVLPEIKRQARKEMKTIRLEQRSEAQIPAELTIEPSAPSPEILRSIPRFAGGIAGGLIGGSTTFGTGTIPGAIAGAGIGGLLGQAGSRTAQQIAGREPSGLGETLKDIGKAGAE